MLTAFLIESYKNLSADESESLLRRIAFQTANYSFSNGHLNTTFDSSQLPTFQAAVSDIRVNVCWFASLVLSLSSASFGIAVKQWLREYLSMDCIDPLERLRIRHARFQGLRDWKLFQIAAFLPILLQIALALFFVGLCFFTAAVHRSIGITSLFLVSCWAFFFFMSVIAPLFSPRCPYKTTLLKVPFRYARPYIQSLPQRVLRLLTALCARLWKRRIARTITTFDTSSTRTRGRLEKLTWHEDHMNPGIIHTLSSGGFCKDLLRGEEDMLRSADDNDIVIFCDVDAVFLDDRLLDSMRRTLRQRLNPLADAFQFVIAVVQRRSGFTLAEAASRNIERQQPWPWTLSHFLRAALVDMLVESMQYELLRMLPNDWRGLSVQDSEWSGSFAMLVSLVSPHDVTSSSVTRLFEELTTYRLKHEDEYTPLDAFLYQMNTLVSFDSDWPARSLLFLAQALETLKPEDAEQCLRYISYMSFVDRRGGPSVDTYRHLFASYPCNNDGYVVVPTPESIGRGGSMDTYYPLLKCNMGDVNALTPQTIIALLGVAHVILHRWILEQTQSLSKFPEWITILLEFVFEAVPGVINLYDFHAPLTGASDGPGLYRVLADLFTTPHTTRALLHFFADHLLLLPSSLQSDQAFYLRSIRELDDSTCKSSGELMHRFLLTAPIRAHCDYGHRFMHGVL